MNMNSFLSNEEAGQPHPSVIPALLSVANTILAHVGHGGIEEAVRFVEVQRLPPAVKGFVAACLYKHGMCENAITAVLMH
jgi:hypothetical protein